MAPKTPALRSIFLLALCVIVSTGLARSAFAQDWDDPTEEDARLTPGYLENGDRLGVSLALEGDVLVSGAFGTEDDAGAAHIVMRDFWTRLWQNYYEITASDADDEDAFGYAVGTNGEIVVVGAYEDDEEGTDAGAIYFFSYDEDDDEWVEDSKVVGSDTSDGDAFGFAIDMDDDVLVVGAYLEDENGVDSGSVYVYRYDGDTGEWDEEQELLSDDDGDGDGFGFSVDVSGDVIVVGAYNDDDGAGAAYVFRYSEDDEEWVDDGRLAVADSSFLAMSVAVSGDLLAVAESIDPDDDGGVVHVYGYSLDDESWDLQETVIASDTDSNNGFGTSVSMFGDLLVVGTIRDDSSQGAAYVYRFDPGEESWTEELKLISSVGEDNEWFGSSTALDGVSIGIGAARENSSQGALYIYYVECGFDDVGCECADPQFKRGDIDGNGEVAALLDALRLLQWQFGDEEQPPCDDASDVDDNGSVSALVDALTLLLWQFGGGDIPPAPGPVDCSCDPTDDDLGCETPADVCG